MLTLEDDKVVLTKQSMVPMRDDLVALFDRSELKKYYTEEELPPLSEANAAAASEETH
jgi:succinate dehydrogenase / fumarate reductase flavoprotein subunit